MSESDAEPQGNPVQEEGFANLLEMLSTTYGFDFREYKETSLARRIRVRMSQVHMDSFPAYSRYLAQNPDEHVALFNTILINVTGFFRDPEAWKVLRDRGDSHGGRAKPRERSNHPHLERGLLYRARSRSRWPFSWPSTSATERRTFFVKIYGTDVDEDALATARHGLYRLDQLKDVPADLLDRYFTPDGPALSLPPRPPALVHLRRPQSHAGAALVALRPVALSKCAHLLHQ